MEKQHRILVADDDESVRSLLDEMLTRIGYAVETAADGFEAISMLAFDIDLILLDLMMPGMDGFDVARQMKETEAFRDIPIIMVTGLSSREDRIRAIQAGANDFIAKPVDLTEVKVRVASLLKMKDAQDRLKRQQEELEKMVDRRTIALRKAMQDVVTAQRELENAHMETIHRLVIAAEFKDKGTASHIQRMSQFSAMLARLKNLPPRKVELVRLASPMHDIGKIGTPEAILMKPGKLDLPQWDLMRQHPVIGKEILTRSASKLLQTGEIIAISHHEKWDGSGYPYGLQKEQIPLIGRICAVADVFDALTSVRPYKRAYSNQKALRIMTSESGRHFDPELFELFIQNMDEVADIQQRFAYVA